MAIYPFKIQTENYVFPTLVLTKFLLTLNILKLSARSSARCKSEYLARYNEIILSPTHIPSVIPKLRADSTGATATNRMRRPH